jgi:putative ubiquitin-RnfH superfamily antitoxin RatB of RatAB toxin-antitoxin module
MTAVRIPVSLAIALLAALSLQCAASPFSVQLGTERVILDTPPGFSDSVDLSSPRLQDLAATLTSASNKVLMFALDDADMRRFMNGDQIEMSRYLLAVTPKGAERERASIEQFARIVSDSLRDLGTPVATTDYIKYIETQPVGRANLFAELIREPNVVSVLQATRLPPLRSRAWEAPTPQYLFFSTTLLLVRGKSLRLGVYSLYGSPSDIDWIKDTTKRWSEQLLRLNSR